MTDINVWKSDGPNCRRTFHFVQAVDLRTALVELLHVIHLQDLEPWVCDIRYDVDDDGVLLTLYVEQPVEAL